MREIVIESETRSKFCPVINSTCQGSKCMMWKWHPESLALSKTKSDSKIGVAEVDLTLYKGSCKF